jgi:hypothetical protein
MFVGFGRATVPSWQLLEQWLVPHHTELAHTYKGKPLTLNIAFNATIMIKIHILPKKNVDVLYCPKNQFNICWQKLRYTLNSYSIAKFPNSK